MDEDDKNRGFTNREALFYHSTLRPGKIEIVPSKPVATQRDLSLAYSPGVAAPVEAIAADPLCAGDYTARAVAALTGSNLRRICWLDLRRTPSDRTRMRKRTSSATTRANRTG